MTDKITIERETLMPCPFCGNPDVDLAQMPQRKGWLTVQCGRCESSGPWCTEEAAAVASWNSRAAQPAPAAVPQDERAAFEKWIRNDGGDLKTFGAGVNMHYVNSAVNNAWTGWKARAMIAAAGDKT